MKCCQYWVTAGTRWGYLGKCIATIGFLGIEVHLFSLSEITTKYGGPHHFNTLGEQCQSTHKRAEVHVNVNPPSEHVLKLNASSQSVAHR
jgi:hypothetical protein